MKKPIAIGIALIILTMIIGFERIERGFHFLISDNRTERARVSEMTLGDSRDNPPSRPRDDRPDSAPNHSSSSMPQGLVMDQASQGEKNLGGHSLAINVTGDRSPLHYIKSSAITGSSENSEIELERLRQAVKILGDGLNPSALIFDSDALTTSEAPFILFARDGFDLTVQAKLIYERLQAEAANKTPARTANVEQVGAPNP